MTERTPRAGSLHNECYTGYKVVTFPDQLSLTWNLMLCLIPSSQTLAKCLCLVFSPRTPRHTGGFLAWFSIQEREAASPFCPVDCHTCPAGILQEPPTASLPPRTAPPPGCLPVVRLTCLGLWWIPVLQGAMESPPAHRPSGPQAAPPGSGPSSACPSSCVTSTPAGSCGHAFPLGAPAGTPLHPNHPPQTFPSHSPSLVKFSL